MDRTGGRHWLHRSICIKLPYDRGHGDLHVEYEHLYRI
jgi:hypothetical protein